MKNTPDNVTEVNLEDAGIYAPPPELFSNKARLSRSERAATEDAVFIFDHLEILPDGRPQTWLKDFKRPRKGILSPDMFAAVNLAKMRTMGYMSVFGIKGAWTLFIGPLFLPWRQKIKLMEGFLTGWCREMDYILTEWYMEPHRYQFLSQEIHKFIETFLVRLGITKDIAFRTARAFVTLIEYDSQYHYRLKDIFYQLEDNKELVRRPEAEISRLMAVMKARDKAVYGKFYQFAKLANYLLKVPRIRRAFKQSAEELLVYRLWPDKDDSYWMLRQTDYDYDGRPFAERWKMFEDEHRDPKTGEVVMPRMMKFVTVYEKDAKNAAH